jgi:hypothetical protein
MAASWNLEWRRGTGRFAGGWFFCVLAALGCPSEKDATRTSDESTAHDAAAAGMDATRDTVSGGDVPARDLPVGEQRDTPGASAREAAVDVFRFPESPPPGCVPDCLWRLFVECTRPPSETCQSEVHPGGVIARCYSSGAKVVRRLVERQTVEYRPDGTVCMSYERDKAGKGGVTTYRDGRGNVVAVTRDLDDDGEMVEVECDGRKALAELSVRCALVDRACPGDGRCPL